MVVVLLLLPGYYYCANGAAMTMHDSIHGACMMTTYRDGVHAVLLHTDAPTTVCADHLFLGVMTSSTMLVLSAAVISGLGNLLLPVTA